MREYQNGHNPANIAQVVDVGSTTSQKDDQQFNKESDTTWDEASLARLLGYDDYSVKSMTQPEVTENGNETTSGVELIETEVEIPPNNNVVATHELFDDPQLGKTQPTFATNPFAKFGTVGLVLLVVFGAAATFLNTIMSGKPKAAPKIAVPNSSKPKVEIADDIKPKEVETGKLKAELALGSQAEKIKSLERSKSPKTSVVKTNSPTKNELNKRTTSQVTSPEVERVPVSHPVQVSHMPRPIPEREFDPPRFTPVSRPQRAVNKVAATPLAKHSTESSIADDPMKQWVAINQLGSYGGTEIATNTIFASETNEQPNNSAVDTVASQQTSSPVTIKRATPVQTISSTTIETADSLEPLYAEEAAIINGVPVRQLTVGATASGKLVTPLIWGKHSTNNASTKSGTPTEGEKFIVQLVEPITEEGGFVTLPKGTQIVVYVRDIEKSGLVQLEATQIVIDGNEYVLPAGAISIRGSSGQPLMASKWGDKGAEIASRDAGTFVVGSLAKVGKVLNQPKEEQYSASNGFGGTTTFSSTRRGGPNILGAVLEGGFEPLTEQILERNKRALSEIQQREEVWYVRGGTDVQVFVNQSFQF